MLRIIAGTAKGKKLKSPTWQGTRPMTDKVRGALFNILFDRVIDARILDLFAGTGAVGIEALSRGASHVDSVDVSAKCVRLIQYNASTSGFADKIAVHKAKVEDFVRQASVIDLDKKYDVIFFTPPYKIFSFDLLAMTVALLDDCGMLVAEMSSRDDMSGLEMKQFTYTTVYRVKEYGDTRLVFLLRD